MSNSDRSKATLILHCMHDVDFKFTHPNASSYTLNVHTGKYDKFIYKAFDT